MVKKKGSRQQVQTERTHENRNPSTTFQRFDPDRVTEAVWAVCAMLGVVCGTLAVVWLASPGRKRRAVVVPPCADVSCGGRGGLCVVGRGGVPRCLCPDGHEEEVGAFACHAEKCGDRPNNVLAPLYVCQNGEWSLQCQNLSVGRATCEEVKNGTRAINEALLCLSTARLVLSVCDQQGGKCDADGACVVPPRIKEWLLVAGAAVGIVCLLLLVGFVAYKHVSASISRLCNDTISFTRQIVTGVALRVPPRQVNRLFDRLTRALFRLGHAGFPYFGRIAQWIRTLSNNWSLDNLWGLSDTILNMLRGKRRQVGDDAKALNDKLRRSRLNPLAILRSFWAYLEELLAGENHPKLDQIETAISRARTMEDLQEVGSRRDWPGDDDDRADYAARLANLRRAFDDKFARVLKDDPSSLGPFGTEVAALVEQHSRETDQMRRAIEVGERDVRSMNAWRLQNQKRLADLSQELATAQSNRLAAEQQLDRLKSKTTPQELSPHANQLAEMEHQCTRLQREIAELQREVAQDAQYTDRLQHMLDEKQRQVHNVTGDVKLLQSELARTRDATRARKKQETADLKHEAAQRKWEGIVQGIAKLTGSRANTTVNDIGTLVEHQYHQIDRMKTECKSQKDQLAHSTQRIGSLKHEVQTLRDAKRSLETELRTQTSRMAEIEARSMQNELATEILLGELRQELAGWSHDARSDEPTTVVKRIQSAYNAQKSKIEELESRLATTSVLATGETQRLNDEIARLAARNAALEKAVDAKGSHLAEVAERERLGIAHIKKLEVALRQSEQASSLEIEKTKDEKQRLETSQRSLQADMHQKTKELDELARASQAQFQQLRAEMDQLSQGHVVFRENADRAKRQVEARMQTLQTDLREKEKLVSDLTRTQTENEARFRELDERMKERQRLANEERQSLTKERDTLTQVVEDLGSQTSTLKQELDVLRRTKMKYESETQKLQARIKEASETADRSKKEIGELQRKLDKQKHEHEENVQQLQSQLRTQQAEASASATARDKQQAFHQQLERTIQTHNQTIARLESEIATAENQHSRATATLNEENARLEARNHELSAKILAAESDLARLKDTERANEQRIQELQSTLETNKAMSTQELSAIQNEKHNLESRNEELERVTRELEHKMAIINGEQAQIEAERKEIQAQSKVSKSQKKKFQWSSLLPGLGSSQDVPGEELLAGISSAVAERVAEIGDIAASTQSLQAVLSVKEAQIRVLEGEYKEQLRIFQTSKQEWERSRTLQEDKITAQEKMNNGLRARLSEKDAEQSRLSSEIQNLTQSVAERDERLALYAALTNNVITLVRNNLPEEGYPPALAAVIEMQRKDMEHKVSQEGVVAIAEALNRCMQMSGKTMAGKQTQENSNKLENDIQQARLRVEQDYRERAAHTQTLFEKEKLVTANMAKEISHLTDEVTQKIQELESVQRESRYAHAANDTLSLQAQTNREKMSKLLDVLNWVQTQLTRQGQKLQPLSDDIGMDDRLVSLKNDLKTVLDSHKEAGALQAQLTFSIAENDRLRRQIETLNQDTTKYSRLVTELSAEKWRLLGTLSERNAEFPTSMDSDQVYNYSAGQGMDSLHNPRPSSASYSGQEWLHQQNKQLTESNQMLQDELNTLHDTLRRERADLQSILDQKARVEEKLEQHRTPLVQDEGDIGRRQEEVRRKEQDLGKLQRELGKTRDMIETEKKELIRLETEKRQTEDKLNQERAALAHAQDLLVQSKQAGTEHQSEARQKMDGQLANLNTTVQNTQKLLFDLTARKDGLQHAIESRSKEAASTTFRIKEEQEKIRQENKILNQKNQELREKNAALEETTRELQTITAQKERVETILTQTEQKVGLLTQQVETLRIQDQTLQQKSKALTQNNATLERKVAELERQIKREEERLASATAQKAQLEIELRRMNSELQDLNTRCQHPSPGNKRRRLMDVDEVWEPVTKFTRESDNAQFTAVQKGSDRPHHLMRNIMGMLFNG